MSNRNNIEERTWEDVLTFEEFDLEEVYTESGVRDVLTTIDQDGVVEDLGEVGITEAIPSQEVSLTSMIDQRDPAEETSTMSLADMVRNSLENVPEEIVYEEVEDNTDASIEEELLRALNSNGREEVQSTREEGEIEVSENNNNNSVSLSDLFSMGSNREEALDNRREITLFDIKEAEKSSTYKRPEMSRLVDVDKDTFEFGEDVIRVEPMRAVREGLRITKEDYNTFNEKSYQDLDEHLNQERQREMRNSNRIERNINQILTELFGRRIRHLYGYDKVGRTPEGLPYVKAVLATRFTKLNDRRFRQPSEMRSRSRNVAVANKNRSVLGYIEMTIKGEQNGDLTVNILDSEGERIPYLEDKLLWLKNQDYDVSLWVLYLKTQFEFEETIASLEELKTTDFPVK